MDEFLTFRSCNRKAIQFLRGTPNKFRINVKAERQRSASRVFHDGFDENDEVGEYETSFIYSTGQRCCTRAIGSSTDN